MAASPITCSPGVTEWPDANPCHECRLASPERAALLNSSSTTFAPRDNPNARPLIRFRGMTKRFGLFAIEGPDLAIYPCELFALLGPSGRAKTAMMWMLAGFETSTEGKIDLDGCYIVSIPPHWRPVNMMFISCAVPASERLGQSPLWPALRQHAESRTSGSYWARLCA